MHAFGLFHGIEVFTLHVFYQRHGSGGLIIHLAHHQSRANGYWTEPHAGVNRGFTRVLFTSNWGSTSAQDVDAYMVQLPPDLFQRAKTLSCPAP